MENNIQSQCHPQQPKLDYLLLCSGGIILVAYVLWLSQPKFIQSSVQLTTFLRSVFELINIMWWGILIGMLSIGLLGKIPREFVVAILGKGGTFSGVLRATLAGVLLDLCSHGILLVGTKLYERGASVGQMMAFLIASPWNSFSLTILLVALVGLQWTLVFIVFSMTVAIVSGILFDTLVKKGVLPRQAQVVKLPTGFRFFPAARQGLAKTEFSLRWWMSVIRSGILGSRMVVRWILFGVVLSASVRTFMPAEQFMAYFGASLAGLGLTIAVATILEVCSEGTLPVAADLLTRARAPGNSFAFLMTGVATDYTEIMAIREVSSSWKISLFLPLVTVPQVILLAWFLNNLNLA